MTDQLPKEATDQKRFRKFYGHKMEHIIADKQAWRGKGRARGRDFNQIDAEDEQIDTLSHMEGMVLAWVCGFTRSCF